MKDKPAGEGIRSSSDRGITATHATREVRPLRVAPTTGEEFNTLALDIEPVACMQLTDVLFQFDSSFVMPPAGVILAQLPKLRADRSNAAGQPPISIFGHADPVGDDEYNKQLSGRRARAVFGLVTRDTAVWESLFNTPFGGDNWQTKDVTSVMRGHLGESSRNLARKQLMEAYMASLCPFQLTKSDFLADGADPKGKGDVQGCSEFNPLLVLSKDELAKLSKGARDQENEPNRRVVIFLFRPGLKVSATDWPCPRFDEPTAGCRKRFFVNPPGDQRRASGAQRKEFDKTKDTFACRFYDRIARLSPCETPKKLRFCCKQRGVVVSNVDPLNLGRLQVSVPSVFGDGAVAFAMPAVPFAGNGVGFLMLPPIGTNVWVDFENGDPDLPVWSGCFWSAGEAPGPIPDGSVLIRTQKITFAMNSQRGFSADTGLGKIAAGSSTISLDAGPQTIDVEVARVSFDKGVLEVI